MSPKQHTELLSPISKLAAYAESTDKKIDSIVNSVVLLVRNSNDTYKEIKTQTGLLTDIKGILLEIKENASAKGKAPKGGGMSLGGAFKIGGFMVLSAMALAASSYFLKGVVPVSAAQLVTAIAISFAMVGITRAFIQIYQELRPVQSLGARAGNFALDKLGAAKSASPISQKSALGMTFAIMIGSVLMITAASVILQLVKPVGPFQLATAFLIGISLAPMAGVFASIVIAMKKGGIRPNKQGLKTIGMAALGIILITAAIAGVAQALQLLPPQLVEPPEIMWVLQTGFMLYVFSFSFAKVIKATKGMSTKDIIKAGFVFPLMAIAIIGVAKIFGAFKVNYDSAPPVEWSLTAGLAILVFGLGFIKLSKSLEDVSLPDLIKGVAGITLVALSIVGVSYIFEKLGSKWIAPPLKWSIKSGLAIFAFGFGFVKITNALKRTSFKDMVKGTVAVGLVALAIVGVNFIFQYLVDEWKSPPVAWALKSGLALAVFGLAFVLVTKTVGKLPLKDLLMGVVGMAAVAVGILAVAWIFSILPTTFTEVPMGWVLGSVVALIGFGVVVGIIGAIIMLSGGTGLAAIALGVVGMIIIAAGILAVAWILSYIPAGKLAEVAKGLTDALLAPVNGIVDILARLKNEIGVENLVPLAGGILAISGSLIALAAATAGVAVAGLGASLADAGSKLIGLFTGGETEKPDGPIQILEKLAGMHTPLQKTANAMKPLSESFKSLIDLATVDNIEKLRDMSKAPYYGYFHFEAIKEYPKFLNEVATGFEAIKTAQSGMDMQILDKTTEMIKALAYLNKFGGDNAMEKLGKALVGAVQELSDMISKFGGKIEEQTKNGNESSSALSNATSAISNFVSKFTGGGSGGSSSTPQISNADMSEVVDAIEELQRIVKMNKGF